MRKNRLCVSIFEKGKWHSEGLSVAKIMNRYSVSVGKTLAKPFQNVFTAPTTSSLSFEFHLTNVTVNFVRNALRSLIKGLVEPSR